MKYERGQSLRNDFTAHILATIMVLLASANIIILALSAKNRMIDFWGEKTPPRAPLWFAFIELIFIIAILFRTRRYDAGHKLSRTIWVGILVLSFLAVLSYNICIFSDILYIA